MQFPLVFPITIVAGGAILARYDAPFQFAGPGDVLHPVSAWALWTADDWAAMCPGWTALPLIDTPPAVAGKRAVARPMADWTVGADAVTVTYQLVDLAPVELAAQAAAFEGARAAAIAANNAAAGRAREAYLTAVPGQATTYAAKQAEVARWVTVGRPADATADVYPWAGDRAALRSVTIAEVLAEWEAVTAAWEVVGRQIETERERVNLAIEQTETPDAIQAARDSADYPSPA